MPIRVMVVDDSAFMRRMITDLLQFDPSIRVVAQACNGQDALSKLDEVRPDVITLDVQMPVMDGLQALEMVMRERPTPVVMLSVLMQERAEATLRALELGAVDFVAKPSSPGIHDISAIREDLIAKVTAASQVEPARLKRPARLPAPRREAPGLGNPHEVVVIGASTGGPRALGQVFAALPEGFAPSVVVVQHMPAHFVASFAARLNGVSPVPVRVAEPGDTLEPGSALVAPGGRHMSLDGSGKVVLTNDPPIWGVCPAVDVTMISAAASFMERTVGVLLTGMGRDGAAGIQAIHRSGGRTIVESPETCVIYGMPRAAVETGCVDEVVRLENIPEAIVSTARRTRRYA